MVTHRESEVTALQQADRAGSAWVISDGGPLMTAMYSLQRDEWPEVRSRLEGFMNGSRDR